MDTTLIIFAAGTAASFLPMYWIATRLSARRAQPAIAVKGRSNAPSGRREFIELLQREAASRAVAVLHEALVEARLAADQTAGSPTTLSAETRRSLDETGRLIDSLFSGELRQIFNGSADALAVVSLATIGAVTSNITRAIAAFERSVDGGVSSPGSTRVRRKSRSTSWFARRGWFGAGDVGVTA